jgi:cobalt-precorrin 5A hydrolase
MDDNGKFIISLVSGHLGGANELTEKIAKLINGQAVITTATDINNKVGIDTLARKFYWEILNKNEILVFNKAILDEKLIKIYINILNEESIKYQRFLDNYLKNQENNTLETIDGKNTNNTIENIDLSIQTIKNKISSQNIKVENLNDIIVASVNQNLIFFKEKKIVLGIGAKANVSKEKVISAIQIAMNNLNLPIERIDYIATAEIKKEEKGILEVAREINKPIEIVAIDEIKNFKSNEISKSEFVEEKFGIVGVAEPSALIVAKNKSKTHSKLIHKKIAIDGVTVAVATQN